jgi:glycosyltransferase involved in cell wall biosynthesis
MPEADATSRTSPQFAVVLKGYPRLSETFVAQELLALERRGLEFEIWSLRQPTDKYLHPMHRQIQAPCRYLPEYLHDAPWRVASAIWHAIGKPGFGAMWRAFWADFRRDTSLNRIRRFGQACVLGAELNPSIRHLYVHFLHTPGSVARYTALLTGRRFSFSAHAKDIWTIPDWEKREKIAASAWGVTCTRDGAEELRRTAEPEQRAKVHLVYHGLDLARFPAPPERDQRRDGTMPGAPVRLISVGRAVAKKGFDDLVASLATVSSHWHLTHIGSGPMLPELKAEAERLGISDRIRWLGSLPQDKVIEALRDADLFVLPSKPGPDGDRDGLPNVLMEAATQALPMISTRFAAVPEFIRDGEQGVLIEPGDRNALAAALESLIGDPDRRSSLGNAARQHVVSHFSLDSGIEAIETLLRKSIEATQAS